MRASDVPRRHCERRGKDPLRPQVPKRPPRPQAMPEACAVPVSAETRWRGCRQRAGPEGGEERRRSSGLGLLSVLAESDSGMENTPGMRHRGAFTFYLARKIIDLNKDRWTSGDGQAPAPVASGAAGLHHIPSGRGCARVELFHLGALGSRAFNRRRRAPPRKRH